MRNGDSQYAYKTAKAEAAGIRFHRIPAASAFGVTKATQPHSKVAWRKQHSIFLKHEIAPFVFGNERVRNVLAGRTTPVPSLKEGGEPEGYGCTARLLS
jgi:hypothetical protein